MSRKKIIVYSVIHLPSWAIPASTPQPQNMSSSSQQMLVCVCVWSISVYRRACCKPDFSVKDAQHQTQLKITGPVCGCQGPCCPRDQKFIVSFYHTKQLYYRGIVIGDRNSVCLFFCLSVCLSVCLSICPSRASFVTKQKNILPIFWYRTKG